MSQEHGQHVLGVFTSQTVCEFEGRPYVTAATGRIIDVLARHYHEVLLCAPCLNAEQVPRPAIVLEASNVSVVPQPHYRTTLRAMRHLPGLVAAYVRTVRRCDALFIRGGIPCVLVVYLLAWLRRCRVCHWQVGNPFGMLRAQARRGWLLDTIGYLYALFDRASARLGRRLCDGAVVCNGAELGEMYASPRTIVTASSTVKDNEFYERDDTCTGEKVRILFVGYIRPEKGIEYLLEALALLRIDRPWEAVLIGSVTFASYRKRLDDTVARLGLAERVHWRGFVEFGEPMYQEMRAADIFAFPTLSEGTPHVLVEARAVSLPIVSTNAGGVPDTVADGYDALLVPPKDPAAMARALERVIGDGDLRRALIRNGRESARHLTVERFGELIRSTLVPK